MTAAADTAPLTIEVGSDVLIWLQAVADLYGLTIEETAAETLGYAHELWSPADYQRLNQKLGAS